MVLFSKYDVYDVLEDKKKRLRAAYQTLPDGQALDEEVIKQLKAKYMMDVPVLRTDEMSYEEGKTQIDARRQPNRIFFGGSGPVFEEALQLTIHIPFDGDPGVFNISPSAYNGKLAEGEIVDQELLLQVTVIDPAYDVRAHIDREVRQINWALTSLREKDAYFRQELGNAVAIEVQKRRRALEARSTITERLNIPLRKYPSPSPGEPMTSRSPRELMKPSLNMWDVFVSHASEDKPYVAQLVTKLEDAGVKVWYDRIALDWGDDLRSHIDNGLINCRYGIVILSKAFLGKKKWTEHELNGLFAREKEGQKLILPIWHGITREDLLTYSPALADRLAKITATDSDDDIVATLLKFLGNVVSTPQIATARASEATPKLGEVLSNARYAGPDGKEFHLIVYKSASSEKLFILKYADGTSQQGSLQDIALKYVVEDRKLTMGGYKRMGFGCNGSYPQFNL